MRNISILGSTGSIGCNAIDVLKSHSSRFNINILTGHNNYTLLAKQVFETKAKTAVLNKRITLPILLKKN